MNATELKPLVKTDQVITRGFTLDNFECRDDNDRLLLEGHAAVFDEISEDLGGFREKINRGAFRAILAQGPDVRLLLNHDKNLVLARTASGTMTLKEDVKGLLVSAEMAPTTYGKDLRILLQRRDINQMSFGFRVDRDEWTERDDGVIRTIHSLSDLFDVSVVTFPAYPQTDAASLRQLVCGIEVVSPSGEVNQEELTRLMYRIGSGEQQCSLEERSAIDHILENTPLVSSWMVLRNQSGLSSQTPDLSAAILGNRETVTETKPSGEPYRLAARRRRLRALTA